MNKAYQVPKQAILDWLNTLLGLHLTKVEECATAAVYCQVFDCLYPNTFQFSKVKWSAKFGYEYMENFKIL